MSLKINILVPQKDISLQCASLRANYFILKPKSKPWSPLTKKHHQTEVNTERISADSNTSKILIYSLTLWNIYGTHLNIHVDTLPLISEVFLLPVSSYKRSSCSKAALCSLGWPGTNTVVWTLWLANCLAQFIPWAPWPWQPHRTTTTGRWWLFWGDILQKKKHCMYYTMKPYLAHLSTQAYTVLLDFFCSTEAFISIQDSRADLHVQHRSTR